MAGNVNTPLKAELEAFTGSDDGSSVPLIQLEKQGVPVTSIDVINVIRTLKNNVDELSVNIIKRNCQQIAYSFALLFNQFISTDKFPSI